MCNYYKTDSNSNIQTLTQISGRNFLPELCGQVHPQTAPLQAVCCAPRSTEQSTSRGREKRAKRCREIWRKRGSQQRGLKRKKDAWKQVNDGEVTQRRQKHEESGPIFQITIWTFSDQAKTNRVDLFQVDNDCVANAYVPSSFLTQEDQVEAPHSRCHGVGKAPWCCWTEWYVWPRAYCSWGHRSRPTCPKYQTHNGDHVRIWKRWRRASPKASFMLHPKNLSLTLWPSTTFSEFVAKALRVDSACADCPGFLVQGAAGSRALSFI